MTDVNNKPAYFAYLLAEPVDLGFNNMSLASDIVKLEIADIFANFCKADIFPFEYNLERSVSILNLLVAANKALPKLYWEYEVNASSGVRIFQVVNGCCFDEAIFMKQYSNGCSYIVSPVAIKLPDGYSCVTLNKSFEILSVEK